MKRERGMEGKDGAKDNLTAQEPSAISNDIIHTHVWIKLARARVLDWRDREGGQ